MFTRLKQKAAEKLNRGTATKYPAEFEASVAAAECMAAGTEGLVKKAHVLAKRGGEGSGGDGRIERIGDGLATLGAAQAADSAYSKALLAAAAGVKALGSVERAFMKELEAGPIADYQSWISGPATELRKLRKDLEKRRLEMDAAIAKARDNDTEERQAKEEKTTADHEATLAAVKALLARLPAEQTAHIRVLKALASAQKTFAAASAASLTATLKKL